MNVFVLTTGRTGSLSFEKACSHITNFTSSHESRCQLLGKERLAFPENHIEIDNRLAWFLGKLEKEYGNEAFYIHLRRDNQKVADSYLKRWSRETSIVQAYAYGILKMQEHQILDKKAICHDYVNTVEENVKLFLADKSNKLELDLDTIDEGFRNFWKLIDAEGNLDQALADLSAKHNATGSDKNLNSFWNKTGRVIKKLPHFIKNA